MCFRAIPLRPEGRGLPRIKMIDLMHRELIGLDPDLTVLIDLDPELAASRDAAAKGADTRFESFGACFMRTVRGRLLRLSQEDSQRFHVVNGENTSLQIRDHVVRLILEALVTSSPR